MEKMITRTRLVLGAAALLALIIVPVALGAPGDNPQATASAAGVKKKINKLAQRVDEVERVNAALTQRLATVEQEEGGGRPPTGGASGDLTGEYPNPEIGVGAVNSAKVADNSLTGADIDRGTTIVLSGPFGPPFATLSLSANGLRTGFGSGHSGGSTEVNAGGAELVEFDMDGQSAAALTPTALLFGSSGDRPPLGAADPGESRYEATVTLPESFPDDNPPTNSALIYVRDSGGITQLVARFADGDIDVLAEEAP
jgi:hypothetical protein